MADAPFLLLLNFLPFYALESFFGFKKSYQKIRNVCRQISETLAEGSLPPTIHSPTARLTYTNHIVLPRIACIPKNLGADWRDLPNKNVELPTDEKDVQIMCPYINTRTQNLQLVNGPQSKVNVG